MRVSIRTATMTLCMGIALNAWAQEGAKDVKPQPLMAGFARVDITAAAGCEIPGGFEKNIAKGVHDPLYAEAAVFMSGGTSLALVGVDTLMIPVEVVADARQQIEAKTGLPGGNVLIAASHTHVGGPIVDCFGSESDPAYKVLVAQRIAEAVEQAKTKAVEARVSIGVGHEDSVGFNRRFRMKDGSVKTHPGKMNADIVEPAGPIDPDVGVIAVQSVQGDWLGCVVNYTLHGTVLGGSELSADWPCYLRKTIRGGLGQEEMGVVFLNGACGDVTQVDNRSARPSEFGEPWAKRVGGTVGAEVLKVLARADFTVEVSLAATRETLELPIRDLAGSDEELIARESPGTGLGSAQNVRYLSEARLMREMKAKSPTVPVEVQALRIGSLGIVTNTTEYFCALGLSIKQGSPFKPTFVVELANGYNGYSPTADAFKEGGYEIRTARSSYLAPGSGERIVDTSLQLLNRLN